MNQNEFDAQYGFNPAKKQKWYATAGRKFQRDYCTSKGLSKVVQRRIPMIRWLRKYQPKRQFISDVVAGATLGIYNIPQALAYSMLASLPPVYGLYTSFFPPIFYCLLGSSYHVSIGVFSLICLMVGHARTSIIPDFANHTTATEFHGIENLVPIDIVVVLSLLTGIVQLVMALLRLDFLTAYLSDPAVSGLNFGAACHAFASQLPNLFGFKIHTKDHTYFKLFYSLAAVCENLHNLNIATTITGFITIFLLVLAKILIEGRTAKRGIPFPSELIVLILGITFSFALDMKGRWNVTTISNIPLGMPQPRKPRLELVPYLIDDAVSIAIIAFAITVSMGKFFAKKHRYAIDSNQELLALGVAGGLSSLFSSIPPSASLSRSLVNEGSGATTQLSGLTSAGMILLVICFLGPLLEPLPMCILSAIVVVALRSLLVKITEVPKLWRFAKYDAIIWIVTAAVTVCIDLIPGLAAGLIIALFCVVVRSQWPGFSALGEVAPGDFRSRDVYNDAKTLPATVLRFDAALIFTNVEIFKRKVRTMVEECLTQNPPFVLILDATPWTYTDSMGIEAIKELDAELKAQEVVLMLANLRSAVRVQYEKAGLLDNMDSNQFYPSIEEALSAASRLKETAAQEKKMAEIKEEIA